MPRLFVGLALPPETQDAVWLGFADPRGRVPDAKWVPSGNLHVTLAFLGQVGEDRVGEVAAALGPVAAQARAFSLRLQGAGAFPSRRRGRVVWAGIDAPPELSALKAAVDRALEPLGFEAEKRRFHPHVTLARLRAPADLSDALECVDSGRFERDMLQMERVVLFESRLSPRGARYTEVCSFAFEGA